MLIRLLVAAVPAVLAAFCGFGFLASYEPPGSPRTGLAYAAIGIAAGFAAARVLTVDPGRPPR